MGNGDHVAVLNVSAYTTHSPFIGQKQSTDQLCLSEVVNLLIPWGVHVGLIAREGMHNLLKRKVENRVGVVEGNDIIYCAWNLNSGQLK